MIRDNRKSHGYCQNSTADIVKSTKIMELNYRIIANYDIFVSIQLIKVVTLSIGYHHDIS